MNRLIQVILAGGLNPINVNAAISTVKPFGVDVHTGVDGKEGRKNIDLVRAFIQNAKSAFSDNQIAD